jgi:hypothetical protein
VQENAISFKGEVSKPLAMMNFRSWLKQRLHRRSTDWEVVAQLELARDPLSHPALQQMSLEQLADLPFERGIATPRSASIAAAGPEPRLGTDRQHRATDPEHPSLN